jgi:hypothetical protein
LMLLPLFATGEVVHEPERCGASERDASESVMPRDWERISACNGAHLLMQHESQDQIDSVFQIYL